MDAINAEEYLAPSNQPVRSRRDCDCKTPDGTCVSRGNYQCNPDGGASMVICNGGDEWATVGDCPTSCKMHENQQPYCY